MTLLKHVLKLPEIASAATIAVAMDATSRAWDSRSGCTPTAVIAGAPPRPLGLSSGRAVQLGGHGVRRVPIQIVARAVIRPRHARVGVTHRVLDVPEGDESNSGAKLWRRLCGLISWALAMAARLASRRIRA